MAAITKKKHILQHCRWVVYELKAKDFCVFDFVELLFFNGVLQNNYFKKHILPRTKLKYTCLKCLCRSVSLIIIEKYIKDNIHSL